MILLSLVSIYKDEEHYKIATISTRTTTGSSTYEGYYPLHVFRFSLLLVLVLLVLLLILMKATFLSHVFRFSLLLVLVLLVLLLILMKATSLSHVFRFSLLLSYELYKYIAK
jgi:hypothetical protein